MNHQPLKGDFYPLEIPIPVCDCFERLALEVRKRGFKRYSADAILHRIRWEFQIEKGDHEFKANNNWTSALARWFIARHPELPKFFELRALKAERADKVGENWIDNDS